MDDHHTSLAKFQQFIRDRYYQTDAARGTPATFMWLIEEIGELATALAGNDKDNQYEEFADVIAWLCTLANINDIDLTEALARKYPKNGGPAGHK